MFTVCSTKEKSYRFSFVIKGLNTVKEKNSILMNASPYYNCVVTCIYTNYTTHTILGLYCNKCHIFMIPLSNAWITCYDVKNLVITVILYCIWHCWHRSADRWFVGQLATLPQIVAQTSPFEYIFKIILLIQRKTILHSGFIKIIILIHNSENVCLQTYHRISNICSLIITNSSWS